MAAAGGLRGDGFGEERKRLFLVALRQGESVLEACRLVGVSNRTAYNHRRTDPDFARDWALARRACSLPIELLAFERAVDGTAAPGGTGGRTRRTPPSDRLLAKLLEGEKPEIYGRTAGIRVQAKLKKRIRRLLERVEAIEARLEGPDPRIVRDCGAVNFMNFVPGAAPASSRRRPAGERRPGWRLAGVRRRLAARENGA